MNSGRPITRSLQLPHFPVTAFSQTDLFLVWINVEGTLVTNCNHKHELMLTCRHDVDMFTWGCIVSSSPKPSHVDWNWPISREKYLKIDWSVEMPLHWLILWEWKGPSNGLLIQDDCKLPRINMKVVRCPGMIYIMYDSGKKNSKHLQITHTMLW